MRILLADDDPDILEPLKAALTREGYDVVAAGDGEEAWTQFQAERPDFAVLDLTMPGLDGIELTRRIVEAGEPRVPVILLTGRSAEGDKVSALDLGADDYVVKPCSPRELQARIRAVWRRASTPTRILTSGNLALDPATHKFYVEGRQVDVTSNEFLVLLALIERAGQVVRYATLMRAVWGTTVSNDLLRVTIYRLRQKIEPNGKTPRYITTVAGVGFMISGIASAPASATQRQPAVR